MSKNLNLVIIGLPGSGKGTQVEAIKNRFNLVDIATGEIARELADQNTPLGYEVREVINKGELLSDEIIFKVIRERIKTIPNDKGLVFDGFPRNLKQSQVLDEILFRAGRALDKVIYLSVPEEELEKRLKTRLICEKCGYSAFGHEKNCPKCQGKLVKREDDTSLKVVQKRIEENFKIISPLISCYQKRGNLIEINGDQPPKDVTKDIVKILE